MAYSWLSQQGFTCSGAGKLPEIKMKLSIIVPVYNEEQTVELLIEKVKDVKLPKGIEKEIIIVNDGSSDNTPRILKRIKGKGIKIFSHPKNMGKGTALRTGLKHFSGDLVVIQDADLEYDPEDYLKLIKPILAGEAQVSYGSRLKNDHLKLWGKDRTPLPTHWIANRLLSWMTRVLYGGYITDMETCYKMFAREVATGLNLKSDRFEIEPEITAKVLKRGYKIIEVPIEVKPRTKREGKKIGWKDGIKATLALLKYRIRD